MIDAKTIEELQGLLAKATLGPWSTHLVDDTTIMSPAREVATTCDSSQTDREDGYDIEYEQMEADAALIVAMRNALPALLDLASRVERAEQLAYTGAISLASIDEGATRPETWKERAENRQAVFLLAKRRAEAAKAEAAALREALRPFVSHYEPWMERLADGDRMCVYPVHTMGDLRRARSAENERLKTMLTGGNLEIVESEQAWKLRAESSEALVAELREKVERLTKALEPFAKAASDYERQGEFFSDNVELVLRVSVFAAPEYHNSTAVQVGDLRRACTALEGHDNG